MYTRLHLACDTLPVSCLLTAGIAGTPCPLFFLKPSHFPLCDMPRLFSPYTFPWTLGDMFQLLNNECILTLFLSEVWFTPCNCFGTHGLLPSLLGSTYLWDTMAELPPSWYLAPQSEGPWDRWDLITVSDSSIQALPVQCPALPCLYELCNLVLMVPLICCLSSKASCVRCQQAPGHGVGNGALCVEFYWVGSTKACSRQALFLGERFTPIQPQIAALWTHLTVECSWCFFFRFCVCEFTYWLNLFATQILTQLMTTQRSGKFESSDAHTCPQLRSQQAPCLLVSGLIL